MRAKHRFAIVSAGFLAILLLAPASAASLNKSIKIDAGETSNGASTINGSIKVGEGAIVTGDVSTVNGTIRVEDNAQVEDVETVNGSVRVSDGVHSEDLGSVNGSVNVGSDVTVDGEVWGALAAADTRLAEGAKVTVTAMHGTRVMVEPFDPSTENTEAS